MELAKAKSLALELMKLHGLLDQDMPWQFEWRKSRRAAGTCCYTFKKIMLSLYLTPHASEEDVKDTILHEIAHALTKGHGHDFVWQRKAIEIGCNGKRCYGGNNKESLEVAYKLVAKFKAVCINGHEHFKNRMPKRNGSCGLCSNRYDAKYLLTYKPV